MDSNQASITAMMTAYNRWHHVTYDSQHIFSDQLAGEILGADGIASIENLMFNNLERVNPIGAASFANRQEAINWLMQTGAATPIVLARASFAEELLENKIAEGVTQYVILGAGLDTFAFRRPDLMGQLHVFEVDHPASQDHKRQRIRELAWSCPPSLHFVPVDFTRDDLGTALRGAGLLPDRKTFFSWLGVSYYLQVEEVMATLRLIARLALEGSSLVFDYLDIGAYQTHKAAPRVVRMLGSVREIGEPMLSGFDADHLQAELDCNDFKLIGQLGPSAIQQRWFMGRTDYLRACEHVHFVHAVVSSSIA